MQTFPKLPLVEAYVLASGDSEVLHTGRIDSVKNLVQKILSFKFKKEIVPGSVGVTPVMGSFSKLSFVPSISPLPKSIKIVLPLMLLQRARRAISGAGSFAGSDTATLRPTKPRGWRGSVHMRAPGFTGVCWIEGCPSISGIAEVVDDV
jgi:hypothetical protein